MLEKQYGPNATESKEMATYDNLYVWTTFLVAHRNSYAYRFYMTMGSASGIIGTLLIWWAIDRRQLKRQIGANHTSEPIVANRAEGSR